MKKHGRQGGGNGGITAAEARTGRMDQPAPMRPQIRPAEGPPDDLNDIAYDLDPEQVRVRAYEIYQKRNGMNGCPEDDWCEAERQLRAERGGRGRNDGLGRVAGF